MSRERIRQEVDPSAHCELHEFPKPELKVSFRSEILEEMSEDFPQCAEMFERFKKLPSLNFKPGEVVFLFGPNGSGKSTLANAIYLSAAIEHTTRKLASENKYVGGEWHPRSQEEAAVEAREKVLEPGRCVRAEMQDLLSMGASPVLVRRGFVKMDNVQLRPGYPKERGLSDTPTVHRIAVQEMLGELRDREESNTMTEYSLTGRMGDSTYVERGQSSRQTIERYLAREFERINPGSIVFIDEFTFGLSPQRQKTYIDILRTLAQEKQLIIIAPENSGYAFDAALPRIDLREPAKGIQTPAEKDVADRVRAVESKETLPEPTLRVHIDKEKLTALAQEHPKFKEMLDMFAKLPDTLSFGAGKTEVFGDNGVGKSTLLGAIHLLLKIRESVASKRRTAEMMERDFDEEHEEKGALNYLLGKDGSMNDKVFYESLGFARQLVKSGALRVENLLAVPGPTYRRGEIEGVTGNMWVNLLDVSGAMRADLFHVIEWSRNAETFDEIRGMVREKRPKRMEGSTRQSAEHYLLSVMRNMPDGGFLFLDEADGGISPERQIVFSSHVHNLARERGITVLSTSNSWEGKQFPVTPTIDLAKPENEVVPAIYAAA